MLKVLLLLVLVWSFLGFAVFGRRMDETCCFLVWDTSRYVVFLILCGPIMWLLAVVAAVMALGDAIIAKWGKGR